MPEVALVGRSNSGKSSLLNALAGQKVARVSSSPGKTRLLNFFESSKGFRIVDLPGYGFAKRSQRERRQWQQMIEQYLFERENLRFLILIMDIRRSWSEDEQMIRDWCEAQKRPLVVVLNKIDKIKRNELLRREKEFQKQLNSLEIFAISCFKKENLKEFENWLLKMSRVSR